MQILPKILNRSTKTQPTQELSVPDTTETTSLPQEIKDVVVPYYEEEPTVSGALKELVPTANGSLRYLRDLLPCIDWIPRYNLQWLMGDCIAGLTVGLVVIPQAMAYALLAGLTPDFGLYTSFAGAATYWLFGTSKDIVIGTTAVGSLLVGEVINHVHNSRPDTYTSPEIAKTLSFITGLILFGVGLLRLGWLVEVIPYIPVSAFITAASITIICTQFPVMMGIPGINTSEEPYKVIIATLRHLGDTHLDAALGVTCLILLDVVRRVCAKMEVRQPARKRVWATISSLRLTFAMLLYTLVSWLVNRNLPEDRSKFRIVGHIEKGFIHAGPPSLDGALIRLILPQSPIIIVILVIEHIAIAKNFGKRFGYQVNPSQEIMAQGTANVLGPFLGGYSCTGSFGASAVLSKAAVRTPLAGLFSALVLLLALYALTAVFYYIPRAALAGLIIHAVLNLIASPSTVKRYWRLSPFECLIWVIGVVVAIFTGLETSIYVTIGLSLALLLIRIARTKGQVLGKVSIQQRQSAAEKDDKTNGTVCPSKDCQVSPISAQTRDIYLDEGRNDASNPDIVVASPHPGVFIYHFPEGFNYLNQAYHLQNLADHVYAHTRRTTVPSKADAAEAMWCDNPTSFSDQDTSLPTLKAMVIDCSTVNNIDITSVQGLIDTRNALDRWAKPSPVDWHFGGLRNRWSRRALATAGFGRVTQGHSHSLGNWTPIYALTTSFAGATEADECSELSRREKTLDAVDEGGNENHGNGSAMREVDGERTDEKDMAISMSMSRVDMAVIRTGAKEESIHSSAQRLRPVFALDRPNFHADLAGAVAAAVTNAASRTG
ncbi:hypothetical protein PV10_00452 [Exophiala mesophila]|uniref:STAS domain-containing protein n=1 Tax=Exophiala mesophila TaxID=212818 RepID=A0A0D1X4B5_EXOME|nr:uncharacterized protein PV10_00452 [Exophiala mesophila]KIV96610.1 hypothetical protein PV10_00452 [Exophiala mesophila]